jgi:hypothetical protein
MERHQDVQAAVRQVVERDLLPGPRGDVARPSDALILSRQPLRLGRRGERTVPHRRGGAGSQSVKTTGAGGPRGYDVAKKVNGRKRHALVDTDA